MLLPNYELVARLGESRHTLVYEGYRKRNPKRMLSLKLLKSPLSETRKAQFIQRIERLKVLKHPLVSVPTVFGTNDGIFFIGQQYFDGVPLDRLSQRRSDLPLSGFFSIACGVVRALCGIHEAGIVHGGIKPHNILVNPETLEVRLIDLVNTLDVSDVSHFIYDPSFIRETLSYTSPEQTGRIGHRVGFASDLYSLGIVLYEMLSHRVPYFSDDPLELIHSHLAQEAPAVHEIDESIPRTLGRIVSKLMLKEPEKRYRSSKSLLSDLERCEEEYTSSGRISDFPLATSLGATRVTFISKMVGRDEESRLILNEYEAVTSGEFRSLFISGLSGIGKTRLIQELQGPIVKHRGYFASGKFDFYQRNTPYSSLIQAFRGLLRTVLTESDQRVQDWRARLQDAVGQNGKILTDVIPELEILIGPQPEVPQIPPIESRVRFHDVFDRFVTCLANSENPLTLFIDDLQWCDMASFDFLAYLFQNRPNHPHLFFIGAYRLNEVDSSHPLNKLIKDAREDSGSSIKEVRLGPLRPEHCHEMVSYILDSPLPQTQALSDFINTLSEGNPLFVNESLSYLYNENLLFIDDERQWRWDLDRVRSSNMPTTVVALFSSKIGRLPRESLDLLEYCACMGNTLSASELASVRGITLVETFETLKPALSMGLLVETKNELRFIHDKVHEATLSAIPPERRREIHWRVGSHLLSRVLRESTDPEKAENLFSIVAHLNMGRPEDLDRKTAYLLSDLNFHAGNKALAALATGTANVYFRVSRELLPDDCWEEPHYERTFRILQRSARTELMCGNYDDSEKLLSRLLEHAKSDLDRAECLAEQTTSLSSIGSFRSAIETANRGLAYFGKDIPMDPVEADRKGQKLMAEIAATEGDIWQTILNKPFATDRKSKIELAFYSELIPDLYVSGLVPQLYLSAAQSTKHCLQGGMDESVIYSFTIMGLQLGEREEFELAFKYEDLARDLSAKYPNTFGATRGMNGIVWCNMHSRSSPQEIVSYCLKSIQCGKNCGDLYNAGLSYGPLMWNLAIWGADLRAVEDYAKECRAFSEKYHLSFSVGLAEAVREGWIDPMKVGHVQIPMKQKLTQWEENNHVSSAGSFHVLSAITHYYLGEYLEAEEHLQSVQKYLAGLTDNVLKRVWYVFRALNRLRLPETNGGSGDDSGVNAALDDIRPLLEKVEKWASLGPLLKPYKAFLEAEISRATGSFGETRGLYLDAVDLARKQGYVLLEGHLWECLAEHHVRHGRGLPRAYASEAARLYRKCHADRKDVALMERFAECFTEQPVKESLPPTDGDESRARLLPDLDMQYLMKSSLAISAEIQEESLIEKIMSAVLESSGAQNGYLLLSERDGLCVRASCRVADPIAIEMLNLPLDDAVDIRKEIVRYVHRTGQKTLVTGDPAGNALDSAITGRDLPQGSILCLPVIRQSSVIGVMYLKNRLSNSAFTSAKTRMTELLVFQAAISIENSRLVREMRAAEDQIRRSLGEKEVLLKEVHHRVKNNLQVIHSMLNLQLEYVTDQQAREVFKDCQTRIYSIALIHEKLYQSESLARVDLAAYIRSLTSNLFLSYGVDERHVRPEIDVEDIPLSINNLIPCALITNELVSNALKHAFPRHRLARGQGRVQVRVSRGPGDVLELTVRDDGIGLPEGFDPLEQASLGLRLVNVLTRQLNGSLSVRSENGSEFCLTFKSGDEGRSSDCECSEDPAR